LGKGGILDQVKTLQGGGERWKTTVPLLIAVISLIGTITTALIMNWGHVEHYFKQESTDPVAKMIHKVKHPKKTIYIYETPEEDGETWK
jgi:hypothetical protein